MHTFCLCSEILQENTSTRCPSGAVGASLEPDASAGEGSSHRSHTWEDVRGSVCVEIMPLIPSAAAVQETLVERSVWLPIVFNVCVRSPWSCQTRCAAVWTARRGSFADFADFEQCTQVSPANEPSAQRAQRPWFQSGPRYLGSRAFYARAGTRPKNLIQNANQHWVPGGGSSLFVSQGGRWRVTVSVDQDAECGRGADRQASFQVNFHIISSCIRL